MSYPEGNPNDPYGHGATPTPGTPGSGMPGQSPFGPPGLPAQGYGQPVYGQPGIPPQVAAPAYGQPSFGAAGYGASGYGVAPGYGMVDVGAPFGRDPYTGEPLSSKSKMAAGLLSIFLGTLGVGRFYMGHTTMGAIQLALTVIGWLTSWLIVGLFVVAGVSIWAFIDGIMILVGSNVRDGNGYKMKS